MIELIATIVGALVVCVIGLVCTLSVPIEEYLPRDGDDDARLD